MHLEPAVGWLTITRYILHRQPKANSLLVRPLLSFNLGTDLPPTRGGRGAQVTARVRSAPGPASRKHTAVLEGSDHHARITLTLRLLFIFSAGSVNMTVFLI